MTSNLSEEKLAELKAAFELFDQDQKGKITFTDLDRIFSSLGQKLTEDEFKEIIHDVDRDDSNEIEFGEFLNLIAKKMNDSETEEELAEAFKVLDKSGGGYFTVTEFKSVLISLNENLTNNEISEIMKEMEDSNGRVSYDDFVKFMSN